MENQLILEKALSTVPNAFFAYPSQPYAQSEAVKEAAAEIAKSGLVHVRLWEHMSVTGKNIMKEICHEIDKAEIFCVDITGLNLNVMFELGYAIARDKRIWPIFDTSFAELRKQFDQLRLLTTTGYAQYTNSGDIVRAFHKDHPYLDLENTIFRQSIQPTLSGEDGELLVYLKSWHDTNASVRISKSLQSSDIPLIVDDPRESGAQSLSWYGQKIYASVAVVAHFLGPDRAGSRPTNVKYAFISGLAHGFSKPLLMLAEHDYVSPLDYRDLLFNYDTAGKAVAYLQQWLGPIEGAYREQVLKRDQYAGTLRLKVELRDFYVQIGEYLAENETNSLDNYYLETTAYREALEGTRRIFVGRRGTGKTANLIVLASELRKDRNNVVCVLQPAGYEIESLLRLFRLYRERDTKGYVIESLWKFLLLTEIANATVDQIETQPLWVERTPEEKRVVELLEQDGAVVKGDFSVRLERCVSALLATGEGTSVEQQRKGVSEALHETAVKTLRTALDDVLSKRKRVAILIDNLDRAWVRQADIAQLSEFLLGLFIAGNQLLSDFARHDSRRKAVNCTAAVFLRSDIFDKVVETAREPDKLAVTKLVWSDAEMLSLVVEKRFLNSHPHADDGKELWSRYFCPTTKGIETKDYIVSRILPRPRDIVYLVKTAVSIAVNRAHPAVEEADVLSAEYEYSKFALDSIMVENSITVPQLSNLLYEFVGSRAVFTEHEISAHLSKSKIPFEKHAAVIGHLIGLSFLGIEVGRNQFVFSDDQRELRKHSVLANKLAEEQQVRRYQIHPAFRAYLEVVES